MIKIGITGSLASGKTTASKILSNKRGPLFSADTAVMELYRNKVFKRLVSKKFGIKNNNQIKKSLKNKILDDKSNLKKLEKIIHPLVRKKTKEITLMGPRMDYGVIGIKTATRVMKEIGTKESPMVQSLSGMEMDKDL